MSRSFYSNSSPANYILYITCNAHRITSDCGNFISSGDFATAASVDPTVVQRIDASSRRYQSPWREYRQHGFDTRRRGTRTETRKVQHPYARTHRIGLVPENAAMSTRTVAMTHPYALTRLAIYNNTSRRDMIRNLQLL